MLSPQFSSDVSSFFSSPPTLFFILPPMGEAELATLRRGLPGVEFAHVKSICQTLLRVVGPSAGGSGSPPLLVSYLGCLMRNGWKSAQGSTSLNSLAIMSYIGSSIARKALSLSGQWGYIRQSRFGTRKIRDPTHYSLLMRVSFLCV